MAASDIAATGMAAAMKKMETEANNIANSKTTAFKAQMVGFKDTVYRTLAPAGTPIAAGTELFPSSIQLGTGVTVGSIYRNLALGGPVQTEGPLDFYIDGQGYFQISDYPNADNPTVYTRAGNFTLNNQREIVTEEGYTVGTSAIVVPNNTTALVVNRQGDVYATVAGNPNPENLGVIELAVFPNPRGLESIGENLFVQTPASGDPVIGHPADLGYGQLLQTYLEESNVQIMTEMVGMIDSQLLHQVLAEVVKKDSARKESEITIARAH